MNFDYMDQKTYKKLVEQAEQETLRNIRECVEWNTNHPNAGFYKVPVRKTPEDVYKKRYERLYLPTRH